MRIAYCSGARLTQISPLQLCVTVITSVSEATSVLVLWPYLVLVALSDDCETPLALRVEWCFLDAYGRGDEGDASEQRGVH